MTPIIRIQAEAFDLAAEMAWLRLGNSDIGAMVSFTGLCRSEDGTLAALELEHYPGMAEAELARVAAEAAKRWSLLGLSVIHRFGRILPGEDIVLVIACSSHRQAAFDAANFMMDFLKTRAPFWKKEHLTDGSTGEWVAAKEADDQAALRWQSSNWWSQPAADQDEDGA